MRNDSPLNLVNIRRAFLEYERRVRIQNYKVGCILAFIFMPAGALLDYFVYPDKLGHFLQLRLLCSLFLGIIWGLLHLGREAKSYRVLGLLIALLPLFFISWMIYDTEGASSPYYAGLNLVMLGAAILLRWTLLDSVLVFFLSLAAYSTACFLHGPILEPGIFFNNLYFLIVTGVFTITGSWFYNRIRFREFELRYELDQNRKTLEDTNRRLVELDQVKSRFFANVSHELRTPLTLLLSPLETLLHQRAHEFAAEARGLLSTMHANGLRLLKLINDLLDLVRLESGRIEVKREPLEVAEFARGLSNSVLRVAEAKGLKLETLVEDGLGSVLADRDKLEKVVLNLLFNAIKFTPHGGLVKFSVKKDAEGLVLQVEDTGVGISETDLPHVFDRFWQADTSSERKHQGTGIGLALVKELVEAQGGTALVTSQVARGTIIVVRLPYTRADAAVTSKSFLSAELEKDTSAIAPDLDSNSDEWLANLYRRAELFPAMVPPREHVGSVETSVREGRARVLIADDEPDMLHFLRSQLSAHFEVLEAVDGRQAIEMASQSLPDIILLDMMMPEKDGLEVCRELRERTPTKNIPIVLLTARADEATKLAALSAGASDFLTKPFSTTELHLRLKNLVDAHQLQKALAAHSHLLEATLEQLKATETQLVQSEKMASLGRLSAGIIHEIINPLNYVETALYTLRGKGNGPSGDQRADYDGVLSDVEGGIKRVRNIVLDLRAFARPNTEQFDQVNIGAAVSLTLRFLSNEWKDKVRIETRIAEDHTVWANQNALLQVLLNLLQNALDAVKRKTFVNDYPTIWIEGRVRDDTYVLTVRDNGEGIAPEHVNKVFDPFFTTKDVGEGMGLGLSICYRIIEQHGGRISVRSEPGRFSEFTVELPREGSRPS